MPAEIQRIGMVTGGKVEEMVEETEETGAMPAKIRSPTTNVWAEYRKG